MSHKLLRHHAVPLYCKSDEAGVESGVFINLRFEEKQDEAVNVPERTKICGICKITSPDRPHST